jgi:hypothetical protein
MFDVSAVLAMQEQTVARWHQQPLDNPYSDFLGLACQQHQFNFQLWHEEDIARSPDVGDARIAQVKRAIDRFNQQRNDAIEKLDDWLSDALAAQSILADPNGPINTETPGSAVDRLSIIALRIYHLDEQAARVDASDEHRRNVARKAAICRLQRDELARSLGELLAEIAAGRKRHRTYRQFKMYNDPALNPYLYQASNR